MYLDNISDEVEGGLRNNNIGAAYKAVKLLSATRYTKMTVPVNKADGQPVKIGEEALERCREYYEQMLNHPPAALCADLDQLCNTPGDRFISTACPSLTEVRTAIRQL